jgi:hypothetical protein
MSTMTPEERFERIERQLEFSAEILAQLSASQQRQDVGISQLAGAVSTLALVVDEMGNRMEAGFSRTEERQRQTDEQMRRTDEQMRRTDEQMRRTDERLNALISVVERHFSDDGQ